MTERTYFRHFPDKREVLFDGEAAPQAALADAVAAPPGLASLAAACGTAVLTRARVQWLAGSQHGVLIARQ